MPVSLEPIVRAEEVMKPLFGSLDALSHRLPGKLTVAEEAFKVSQEQAATHQKQFEALAQELSTLESQTDALEQSKTTTAQQAQQFANQHKELQTQHQQVKSLAEERSKLTGFAPDLLLQFQSATENVEQLRNEYDESNKHCGVAEIQLKALQKNLTDFRKVEVGISCSRCGQLVSQEHARNEISELEK
jgi:chromosome segregation ATPase